MQEASAKEPEVETVEYTTQGGPDLGGGVHESESALRIDLTERVASLERYQPSSDQGGEALGTFKASVPPELCAKLREALALRNLNDVKGGPFGGPGTSILHIRATHGSDVREVSFSNRDVPLLLALQPLMRVLDQIMYGVITHPHHAVTLELIHHRVASGIVFDLAIKNAGTEPITVPGLLTLGGADSSQQERWLGARIAAYPPERPGFTPPPLEWSYIALALSGSETAVPVVLAPGAATRSQTRPWTPPAAGGRHLAQAVFAFYGAASTAGPPLIRGRALSPATTIE